MVAMWAVSLRKPSLLGLSFADFKLPILVMPRKYAPFSLHYTFHFFLDGLRICDKIVFYFAISSVNKD